MRHAARRKGQEDEEGESAFVSMTDMTVSFLFIVILLLAFFASQFNSDEVISRSRYDAVVLERDDLRLELERISSAHDEALRVIEALRHEIVDLVERLRRRDIEIADLKSAVTALSATNERLRAEILMLRERLKQLEDATAERDQLRGLLLTMTAERDKALDALALLHLQLEDLVRTLELRDVEILALKASIAALSTEIDRLRARIAALEERLKQENPLEKYGVQASEVRRRMLERLAQAVQADIAQQKIEGLTVTAQGDALRFQGSGLFETNQRKLTGRSLAIVRLLGEHLESELPCYSVGPRSRITEDCNPDLVLFETIQVEGHTDSAGDNAYNLDLSAGRALSAFTAIAPDRSGEGSEVLEYANLLGQPLLAFAGYGEMRPIVDEATGDRSANRRIDLRFIMYVPPGIEFIPETVEDLDRVGARLRRRAAER